MKAVFVVCDYAQIADGKLFISGAGWNVTMTPTSMCGLAIAFRVPDEQIDTDIAFEITLQRLDGQPLTNPDGIKLEPIVVGGNFKVKRRPGLPNTGDVISPFVANIPPLPLAPDHTYTWRLSIDGESRPDWQHDFDVIAQPPEWVQ